MERAIFVEEIIESCWKERVSIFIHKDACCIAEDIGKTKEVVLLQKGREVARLGILAMSQKAIF